MGWGQTKAFDTELYISANKEKITDLRSKS
jgi:hypothetical protein